MLCGPLTLHYDEPTRKESYANGSPCLRNADAKHLRELSRPQEAIDFLRRFVARFPDVAELHYLLSIRLSGANSGRDVALVEESIRHAEKAAKLAGHEYVFVSWAAILLNRNRDYSRALRYAKQSVALATGRDEKIEALTITANVYIGNDLYVDARSYLRDALQIDNCNVAAIADMAHCSIWNTISAKHCGRQGRGVMLDPTNKGCMSIRNASLEELK